mgnify:FL=1
MENSENLAKWYEKLVNSCKMVMDYNCHQIPMK